MKKLLLFLLTVLMGIGSLTLSAQNTLTVADGTTTNSYVPVYGLYVDDFVRCQTIYPASTISEAAVTHNMTGGTITGLTYYLSTPAAADWGAAQFVVNIKEVTATTLSAFLDMTDATTVYTGALDATQPTMTITFTTPYTYQGGNLLVEIYNTLEGTFKSASFYGISATGASWQGNNGTSVADITGATRAFIPKTTFTFTGGTEITCSPVQNLAIDATQTTPSSLTLTWTDALNAGATYSVYNTSDNALVAAGISGNTYTVNNLNANTEYTFGVEVNCSATDNSTMMTVTGRTACGAISTLPYTCGFEADELQGNSANVDRIPYCWNRYASGTGSYTYFPYSYNSYVHDGSRALYFYTGTSTSYPDIQAAILPELDVNSYPMSGNRITFWSRMSSSSYSTHVYVGTVSDPSDITTFTVVDSVLVSGTTHTKYSVPLTTATNAYVVLLVYRNAGGGYLTIDDVTLEEMPSCLEITGLSVTGTTSSSMTLSWTDDANTSATYTIYNMSDTSVVGTANTTTYTVDNLADNTEYTFGVQANCTSGDAPIVTVSGRTACAAIATLPYTCGFEADELQGTTNALRIPYCWNRYASGTGSYTYFPYSYNSYVHDGSRALYFYTGTSTSYPDIQAIILPELDVNLYPMSGNRVTFWSRMSSASYSTHVYVGTVSDPADYTTFTLIDSVPVNSATHTKFSVPLTNATDAYVALVVLRNAGGGYLTIDDVTLEEMPSCVEVSNLTVTGTTSSSISLSWVDALNTGATYTIYNMADTSIVGTSNTTTYTVNNLTANTEYTFGVQSICSAGDAVIVTVSGHTDCDAYAAPYTWDFENMTASTVPECWAKVDAGTVNVLNSSSNSHGGTMYVRFSGSTSNLIALPATQDEINTLQLRFWTRPESFTNSSCGSFSVGYMTNPVDASTFVEVVNYVYSDFSAYEEKTVTFAGAPTGARMAMRHNAGSTSWYWYIDDVTIEEAPACLPVSGLTASNITSDAATLTWTSDAGSYNVYDMSDTSLVATVSTASHDLTNLNAMTQYTFGVAANCGSEESPIVTVTLTTACAAVNVPFTETFETTSGTANCWTVDGNGSWSIGTGDYSSATGAFEGSLNALITHGTTGNVTKLISPILDNVDNGMILDFAYVIRDWSGDADELRVYSRSAAESAWQQLAAYTTATGAWTVESVIIPGTVYQIAFEYTDNYGYGLGIDSVVFTAMTGSFCYPVSNLTVTNTTSSSVSLSWSDENNSGASYTIYDMSDNSVVATNVSGTSYDVTGLTAMTGYTFGVAANCSATETSNITTVTAATACAGETCSITISGNDSYGDGWNGNAINLMQGGAVVGTFTLTDGSSYSETFTVCSSAPVSFSWVSGQYPGETSFTILDGGNSSVFTGSGSDMTSGTVFFTLNDACPSCLPATALTVDAATMTSITISWTGTAASYDVYNGLTFVANVTTNSYTFTGLTSATSYVFGVQALCSATDSASVAIITATTECSTAAINLPYHETFSLTSSTRNCWTSIDADNDGFGWTTLTDYTGAEQEALLSYSYYNGTTTALTPDNWAISPKLHSTAGSTVTMQWTVASAPSYPAEHYGVYVSTTTPDITSFTMVDEWTITNGSAEVKVLDLSTYAGQDIYVAFRHHNCTDQYVLKIDDVQLYEGAFTPDTLNVTFAVNNPVMGTTIPAPGTYQYVTGDTVHFTAIANSGYHFVGWEWATSVGVDTLGSNYISASLTLSAAVVSYGNMTFTALFEAGLPDSTTITYAVNDPAMGTINPAPGTYTIYVGDDITATATPNAGYVLSSWMLDIYIGTTLISSDTILSTDTTFANPMHFGVLPQTFADYNATITITAVFEASSGPVTQYTVTLNTADASMGSVSPAGANTVNAGSTFTATATANTGYQFVAWMSGDTQVSQANPYTFTVNGDITLTATFTSGSVEPCDVPTGLHTTDIQNESISIAWDANPNVTSWNIRYREVNGTYTSASSNTNSYTITGLTGLTNYEIEVQAVCASGTSDWCTAITVQTTNVGIEEHLINSVALYPNPAREYVDIRMDGDVNVKSMDVYDVYGKLINTVNVIENPTRINVSGLANGMYFVRVTTEQGIVTKSFIKK